MVRSDVIGGAAGDEEFNPGVGEGAGEDVVADGGGEEGEMGEVGGGHFWELGVDG